MPSSLESEGLSLKFGMLLAEELHLAKVIFETDNSKVAQSIWYGSVKSQVNDWCQFCIEKLATNPDWKLCLIRREANTVADIAAKHARGNGLSWLATDACPLFLNSVMSSVGC